MDKNKKNAKSEQQLLLDNLGVVVVQAKRFKPNAVTDEDDYRQEGAIALLKAIRNYDPTKGKLTTYAWKAILRAIHRSNKKFSAKDKNGQANEIPLDFDPTDKEFISNIAESLPSLTDEEQELIMLRIAGYTLEEIGDMFGKQKQSIRLQLEKIIKKIKKAND